MKRRTRDGVVVTGLNKPGYGGRGFFVYGEALESELAHLHHFLRPGDVFLDVGANSGIFSLKAAKCVGEDGIVVALEPLPHMLYTLHRNVVMNRFSNVRIRNFCAGDQTGVTEFWINQGRPASSGLIRLDPQASKVSVLCMKLDDLAALEGLKRLDYVKIDVEGAEDRILAGARELISRFKPVIQVEINKQAAANIAGYRKLSYSGSPNSLLLPEDHRLNAICRDLGYTG